MVLDYKWILNIIFPRSSDERLVDSIDTELFLARTHLTNTRNYTALAPYADPVVRAAMHCAKFHHHPKSLELLAYLLQTYLANAEPDILLLPVPLSSKRFRQRGYNQVTEVLKHCHCLYDDAILVRQQDTKPQMSLKRAERLLNVAQAFGLRDEATARAKLAGRHILLVDDVVTTGATLQAAAAPLRPLPLASLTCLALAH